LIVRASGRLQRYDVEVEAFTPNDLIDESCEFILSSTGQEDCECIFLFHAQQDELNDLLIPPSAPGPLFFFLFTCAGSCEYSGIVPPASTGYVVLGL